MSVRAKVLGSGVHPEDARGPLGISPSPVGAGTGNTAKLLFPRTVVTIGPQRPEGDRILWAPTTATSALCLPLHSLLSPLLHVVLQGPDLGPLGLHPGLQRPS